MTLIDGKATSAKIKEQIKNEVLSLKQKGITPTLAVILVGEEAATKTYVASKERLAQRAKWAQLCTGWAQTPRSAS